jgi:subtilisin family serine protease
MLLFKAVVSFLVLSMLGSGVPAQEIQIVGPNSKTVLRSDGASAPKAERLLVKLRPGKASAFQRAVEGARALPGAPELFLVPVPEGQSVRAAAQRYAKRADVLYAEPDGIATLNAVPSDARWGEQWDMIKISAPAAWDIQTDSSDQVVAVVDSGIDVSHPDLQANLWTDPLDGSHGVTCRNGTVTAGGLDDNGHGTHVAGTIGAVGDNGTGVAGVNWSVQLLSLKAFDQYGNANISDVVTCMNKLLELRQRGFNIRVANHSWTTGTYSQALRDAFSNAEAVGILQIAAAGNFTTDLDFAPSYPAAFPGRGILAVSSTSTTDGMAPFTNFGHVEVDLAAPGHNILSTVPSGTCSRCDASGYKLLSGTSMATPHVSGVAAALFHLNPLLTPAEVRDLLLDPASFDQLPIGNNYQVLSSTRGGRLNFAKVLANPLLTTPQLNGFPVLSAPARVVRSAGVPVTLSATASDPDGDTLAYQWGKPLRNLLYGVTMNRFLPPGSFNPSIVQTNPYIFTAPSLAVTTTSEYKALVNDGRGGSAAASTFVTFLASPTAGSPPGGQINVTPASGPVGTQVRVTYSGADPEGGDLFWSMISGFNSSCCHGPGATAYVNLDWAGVYRFNVQSIDPEMNLSEVSTTTVRIGGATGEPPFARLTLSATSGPAPLTVSYDATGSYDPDGQPLSSFVIDCEAWKGGTLIPEPPTGTCVFDTPGPYAIGVRVNDVQGYADERVYYVMVTDQLTPDVTAPTAQITAPAPGAPVKGTVTVGVSASDETGVMRVQVYRDSGILLGTDTTEPFSVEWDTADVPLGDHTLYARAYDQAGNIGTAAAVVVSVRDNVAPTVAVVAPASGSSVAGLVSIAADASDDHGVARVEFFLSSQNPDILLGTDTEGPFSLSWDSSVVTPGFYGLWVKAYDQEGNFDISDMVGVTVLDAQGPAVSITVPAAGARVGGGSVSVQVSASDNVGVTRVELLLDGSILLGSDTSSPWSFSWNSTNVTPGLHTLSARAYDQADNIGLSAAVTVTVYDSVNPTVVLLAPAAGGSVSGLVTLEAQASDNVGVTRVEFFRDSGVLLGTDTEAPFSLAWDSSVVTPGSHTFYARAYDLESNQGSSSVASVTVLDSAPPSVAVTAPAAGSSVSGVATLTADASDNVGVTRVEFFRDADILLGTDATEPFGATWDTATVTSGGHTLYAKAYDQAGHVTTSPVVSVQVLETVPPTVTITSPANGASVQGSVLVTASASDNVGVARVDFFLDSTTSLGSDTSAPWQATWNSSTATQGTHSISARAYDVNGNSSTLASVNVTVLDTTPPSVAIVVPAQGSTLPRNTSTVATVEASDNVGVTRVELYVNSKLTSTDTTSPYICSWKTPRTAGTVANLQARAYDARGNVTSSAVVQVTTQ